MNKFLLNLFLLSFIVSANGYSNPITKEQDQFPTYGIMQYFVPNPAQYSNITKPDIYSSMSFQNGKLITVNNEVIKPEGIRYNISQDEMECKIESQFSKITSPHKIKEVNINGAQFIYMKHIVKKDSLSGYLQKVYEGSKNIYVKYICKPCTNINDISKVKTILLIEENGELPKKVRSIKSNLSDIFNEQAIRYMKENKMNWKNADDLIQLFTYLESINSSSVASR